MLDRHAVSHRLVPADRDVPLFGNAAIDTGKKVAVALRRRAELLRRLMAGMRLEDGVAFRRAAVARRDPVRQRTQPLDHAALPVDESAVTVECQNAEI